MGNVFVFIVLRHSLIPIQLSILSDFVCEVTTCVSLPQAMRHHNPEKGQFPTLSANASRLLLRSGIVVQVQPEAPFQNQLRPRHRNRATNTIVFIGLPPRSAGMITSHVACPGFEHPAPPQSAGKVLPREASLLSGTVNVRRKKSDLQSRRITGSGTCYEEAPCTSD